MSDKPGFTAAARRDRRGIAMLAAISVFCGVLAAPAAAQSITDRFKSLFGSGKSDEAAPSAPEAPSETGGLTCPDVKIRAGASTYTVAAPGKEPVGSDVRYQATITRTARDCNLNGGQITARIGIQGRVIAGPAGAPASVEVPLRVAVVQGGVNEKTITTTVVRTTVSMAEGLSVPFSVVAEDVTYPAVSADINDLYIFYIGFDPQALKSEPKSRAGKKK
ncbi:hypothetical protein [uncultured Bradyrhizobium sp.]|uniref:hypothetical protein n=1 Tax=uncultured Bradyrhizobium sp. TaxID=199684 RepID=UPI0035CC920C